MFPSSSPPPNARNRSRRARARVAFAALAVGLGSGAGLVTAALVPGPAQAAVGTYSGSASAQLVTLDALDVPGTFDLANAAVAPSSAAVNSAGGLTGGAQSTAQATNLDINLLSGAIPLDNLLVSASQSAPPDNPTPTTKQLLSLPNNPLLDATVADASAQARAIPASGCPTVGQPIAQSSAYLADASLINGELGSATSSLVALHNTQGATVSTASSVELQSVSGSANVAVVSTATTQLATVTLFSGTPEALTINVVAPPSLTATATGQPGGATVSYTEPILQVVQGGKILGTLDAKDADMKLPLGLGSLSLGTLSGVTQAANGTQAAGQAVLLNLTIGGAGTPLPTVVNLSLAPLSASATAPVGGVACPPTPGPSTNPLSEVHKDLSASVAYAGTPFQYIVAVPNRGGCTLTGVKAVDTVSGPAGTTITGTSPPAASVSGLTTTWDVGSLAPNQTVDLVLTVTPPTPLPAGSYSNTVTVSGTCNGVGVSKTATINGPTAVGPPPVGGTCSVAGSNKAASHLQVADGESFDYYIHVFNSSGANCTGVTVTDTLGPDVTFVSCTAGCTTSGSTVTWHLGSLAPGASEDVAMTVDASSSAPTGTQLPDTATITPGNGSAVSVSTSGPTVTGASVLAPPNPAGPPAATKGSGGSSTSPGSTSTTPGTTPSTTGTGGTTGIGGTGAVVTPSTAAAGGVSPTTVKTGLWFAGSTPYLVGILTFGLLLLAWPRFRRLVADAQ